MRQVSDDGKKAMEEHPKSPKKQQERRRGLMSFGLIFTIVGCGAVAAILIIKAKKTKKAN